MVYEYVKACHQVKKLDLLNMVKQQETKGRKLFFYLLNYNVAGISEDTVNFLFWHRSDDYLVWFSEGNWWIRWAVDLESAFLTLRFYK